MGFTDAIRTCLSQKYATFSGRASRSEYWWFQLFIMLVYMVIVAIFFATTDMNQVGQGDFGGISPIVMILFGIFALGVFLPSIAALVRRLHDRDMSGWWYLGAILAGMIPFVGIIASIALLVILCLKGTDGPNRFGPDPLALHGGSDVFA